MYPNTIEHRFNERVNVHSKSGMEFSIDIRFDAGDWWTLKTYDEKPCEAIRRSDLKFAIRCFDVLASNIVKPKLNLQVIDK